MSVVTSNLSVDNEKKLLSLFGHVRLHLLYKASVHGYTATTFHNRCDHQGPTLIVAYNNEGFVFGAYTAKDYTKTQQKITDEKAFLYSMSVGSDKPLKVASNDGQGGFTDGDGGPNYGALVFLHDDKPDIQSNPGTGFTFTPEKMHGNALTLTEFEVYRVEDLVLLAKPWRKIMWTDEIKLQLKQDIQSYKPVTKSVSQAKVLLVGQVGAGKSSFFNSINSIFRGNMTSQAVSGSAEKSLTTQFRTYSITAGKGGTPLPLILCDTMGLEETADQGLDMEDLISILKGHVKDRYQFSPSTPLEEDSRCYIKDPTLKDKIHCVVYVIDTTKIALLSDKILKKLAAIRKKTIQMNIPQLVLMTKVDEACSLVAEDLKNVYLSTYIQKKAQELSAKLGIPLAGVLPLKNYSQEIDLDLAVDVLLMSAVKQILNYADSFFDNQEAEMDAPHNHRRRTPPSSSAPPPLAPKLSVKKKSYDGFQDNDSSATGAKVTGPTPSRKTDAIDDLLGGLSSDLAKIGVRTTAKGHCASCGKLITGKMITALGSTWHPEHFVCAKCETELGTGGFFERDGRAYCEKDYQELFSPRCAYCKGAILQNILTALDQNWHPDHFFCAHCGDRFGPEGFLEKDGKPYCNKDFYRLFATKCSACGEPVRQNYLNAANGTWHPECFVCADCLKPFTDGRFMEMDGRPLCSLHFHTRQGTLCGSCGEPITGRCISALDRKFHPEHFVCAFCLHQLSQGVFKEEKQKPYCSACHSKLFE